MKPNPRRDAMKPFRRVVNMKAWGEKTCLSRSSRESRETPDFSDLNLSNRRMRTRMSGGVGGDRSVRVGPYPDQAEGQRPTVFIISSE